MCKSTNPFNHCGSFAICSECNQRREKVWTICCVKMKGLQISRTNHNTFLIHFHVSPAAHQCLHNRFICLRGCDVKTTYKDFAGNGTCYKQKCSAAPVSFHS